MIFKTYNPLKRSLLIVLSQPIEKSGGKTLNSGTQFNRKTWLETTNRPPLLKFCFVSDRNSHLFLTVTVLVFITHVLSWRFPNKLCQACQELNPSLSESPVTVQLAARTQPTELTLIMSLWHLGGGPGGRGILTVCTRQHWELRRGEWVQRSGHREREASSIRLTYTFPYF